MFWVSVSNLKFYWSWDGQDLSTLKIFYSYHIENKTVNHKNIFNTKQSKITVSQESKQDIPIGIDISNINKPQFFKKKQKNKNKCTRDSKINLPVFNRKNYSHQNL